MMRNNQRIQGALVLRFAGQSYPLHPSCGLNSVHWIHRLVFHSEFLYCATNEALAMIH